MNPNLQINSKSNKSPVPLSDFLRHERDLDMLKHLKKSEIHQVSVADSFSTQNLFLDQKDESDLNIDRAVVETKPSQNNIMYLEEDSENQVVKEVGRNGSFDFDRSDSFYTIHHPFLHTGKNPNNIGGQNFNSKATSDHYPTYENLESDKRTAETLTNGDIVTDNAEYSSSFTDKTPTNILPILDQNTEIISTIMLSQSSFLDCKNSNLPESEKVTYSGHLSHEDSTSSITSTSTGSFAFPILQRDWCSSPVKMEKADERNYRKYQRLKLKSAFICFQFKKK